MSLRAAADLILTEGTFLEKIDPHQEEDLPLRRGRRSHGEGGLDDRRDRSDVRSFSNLGDDGFIERAGAADDFERGVSGDRIDRVAIGAQDALIRDPDRDEDRDAESDPDQCQPGPPLAEEMAEGDPLEQNAHQ
ncbi:MAG: hypothetical protein MPW15_16820 [Candidatus Manganitrophus sp.]|nr:hypothetical protein [Candidatus Manganitrophus sp.]